MTIDAFIDRLADITEKNNIRWFLDDGAIRCDFLGEYCCPIAACNPLHPVDLSNAGHAARRLGLEFMDWSLLMGLADCRNTAPKADWVDSLGDENFALVQRLDKACGLEEEREEFWGFELQMEEESRA